MRPVPESPAPPFEAVGKLRWIVDKITALCRASFIDQLTDSIKTESFSLVISGGGVAITTGIKGDIEVPFDCRITKVTLLADQAGSIVVDIGADDYASYPPTVADTITASAKPTIAAATKSQDDTLTGWTTSLTAGDILRFNVDSASTVTRVTVLLTVRK